MGLFGFGKKDDAAKKPKKVFELNPGPYKVAVHDTNNTQDLIARATNRLGWGATGVSVALCERTPEQIAAGHPDEHCLNVCEPKSQHMTWENYLGYIDVDRAHAGYLKQVCAETRVVVAHATIQEKGGVYRMNVLMQPPENRKKKKK
jgi:hypothetical protein